MDFVGTIVSFWFENQPSKGTSTGVYTDMKVERISPKWSRIVSSRLCDRKQSHCGTNTVV